VLAEACPWVFGLRRDPEFGSTYLSSSSPYYTIDLNTAHSMVAYAQSNPFPAGSGAYGSSTKTPVAAALDMDGDGDDDLFVAGHPDTSAAQRAVVFFGAVVDEEARAGVGECVRAWLPTYSYTHLSATQAGRFEFEIPPLPSSGPAAAATHVRIAVWRQNAGTSHMERAALSPVVLASTVAPVVLNVSNAPTPGAGGELHLEISYLRLDSSGVMLEAYPAYHETLDHSTRILQSNHVYDFVDLGLPDGIVSGSENRPPITPPAGGGGGSSTP
jgi:hypothetical protein